MSQNKIELSSKTVEELETLLSRSAEARLKRIQLQSPDATPYEGELDSSSLAEIRSRIDALKNEAYVPAEGMPPAYEPDGYSCEPGHVKQNPANNDFYLAKLEGWDWYPAIIRCHQRLEELIPGYNISQIKEKFGSLCYYFGFPDKIEVNEDSYLNTLEKVKEACHEATNYASYWVSGYEAAKADFKAQPEVKTEEWAHRVNWTSPERANYRNRNSGMES